MKQNSNVPAFLTKLWTLVEDSDTNEFICWSQEGHSFLVLDEQRFAKEILPKFFKHNNMASFVRQLNMYGFRKVMHMDTGIVKQERDGPVEFQHPFFKHGQDDLLENIKRKVSSARPEENKMRQEDLSKILSNVQSVHGKQESLDSRLTTLKRENEALWREISDLRQKHTNQQQVIKKLIQFIVSLVQNNHVMSLKRKRPLMMNSNGNKSKFIHQIYEDSVEHSSVSVNGSNNVKKSSDVSDDVIICDVTDDAENADETPTRNSDQMDIEIVEVQIGGDGGVVLDGEQNKQMADSPKHDLQQSPKAMSDSSLVMSNALVEKPVGLTTEDPVQMMDSILNENGAISQNINLLGKDIEIVEVQIGSDGGVVVDGEQKKRMADSPKHDLQQSPKTMSDSSLVMSNALVEKPAGLTTEDPVQMMDSILNENGAISQNINLLGKVELMDYLDSIDCTLEDFQAMLYGKQFSIDPDILDDGTEHLKGNVELSSKENKTDTDKQLIQYTTCPLMAFLDGCSSTLAPEPDAPVPDLSDSLLQHSDEPHNLLDSALELEEPPRSKLIRLEPLTEAEANEATLFYFCELNPEAPGLDV
ncbi:heat shock factor protein 2 isoform X2 [Amia ocellicauda]|uniref:heat shock factor protein 2 isoform X2 n=1 Tax=Amia ocellicauda TaxID=2972642 RepID=UPI0034643965|nr:HSF2 protein [Amia calva]